MHKTGCTSCMKRQTLVDSTPGTRFVCLVVLGFIGIFVASCDAGDQADSPAASAVETATSSSISASAPPTAIPFIRPTSTTSLSGPTLAPPTPTDPNWQCKPGDAEAVIAAFVAAFNAGDWDSVRAVLPPRTHPRSPTTPNFPMAADQFRGIILQEIPLATTEDVVSWLKKRRTFRERWATQDVVEPEIAPHPDLEEFELITFGWQFIRAADDIPSYTVVGKGSVNCVDGTMLFFFGGGSVVSDGIRDYSSISDAPVSTEVPDFDDGR